MKKITNTILAEKMKISHTKVRRWAQAFLPPDPVATMRSGYTKEYDLNDAFKIFLGGHLVADLNYQVHEAKRILEDLDPWMRENGQLPHAQDFVATEEHSLVKAYEIIVAKEKGTFYYRIIGHMTPGLGEVRGKYYIVESKTLEYEYPEEKDKDRSLIADTAVGREMFRQSHRIIRIGELLYGFMVNVLGYTAFKKWKAERKKIGIPLDAQDEMEAILMKDM